jgi:hypothetical protein
MRTLLATCLLLCLATQATAAEWWDEWQMENKWVDHHGWWGPADGGDGHPQAFRTGPGSRDAPFKWVRSIAIKSGVNSTLHFETTTCDNSGPDGDWALKVVVDGQEIFARTIFMRDGWQSWDIDLAAYNGKTIKLELWNAMDNDWWDWAMWDNVRFVASGGKPPPLNQPQTKTGKQGKSSASTSRSRALGL